MASTESHTSGWIAQAGMREYLRCGTDGYPSGCDPPLSDAEKRTLRRFECTRDGPPVLKIRLWFRGRTDEESLYRMELEGNLVAVGIRSTTIDMGTSEEIPKKIDAIRRDARRQMDSAGHRDVEILIDPPDTEDPALTEPVVRRGT